MVLFLWHIFFETVSFILYFLGLDVPFSSFLFPRAFVLFMATGKSDAIGLCFYVLGQGCYASYF